MKRTDTSDWPCTIARSAAVLGDHWNLLLIRQACLGTRRFDEFQTALGIGHNAGPPLNGLVDLPELVDANADAACAGCRPAEIDWPAAAAASLDVPTFLLRGHPDCVRRDS